MSMRTRLHRSWERVRTEPGLKKNVIVIGILLVLATGAGGWVLGNQRFDPPWSHKYEISAEFEAVPGIAPGNGQEVRMNGVIVGQIVGADVADGGHAVVTMKLDPDQRVYSNATLVLRPKSPLNEMYVEIDPGGPPAAVVPSGGTRRCAAWSPR